jgi:hypothetical protein
LTCPSSKLRGPSSLFSLHSSVTMLLHISQHQSACPLV